MGIMAPHIRVLRAEAKALHAQAVDLNDGSYQITAAYVLVGLAAAKLEAADEIQAECDELQNRIVQIPRHGH